MADDFRAYRGVVPSGGVMSALPKAEPTDQEQAYLDAYLADQRRQYVKDDFRAPAPGPSTMDSLKGGAKGLFESMSLFNLVPEAARAAYSGFTLPGDALRGKAPPVNLPDGSINPAAIERSMDFAGLVTLGAGAVPAEANALRTGASIIPEKKPGLSTTNIPLPLKTRGDGLYSKAELESMRFKQPKTTAKDFVNFLKGKGVKKSEIEALGLDKLAPDEVRPTDDFRNMVVENTPKLERVEYTGQQVRHPNYVENLGEGEVGEYREIIYKLPPEQVPAYRQNPLPTREQILEDVTNDFTDIAAQLGLSMDSESVQAMIRTRTDDLYNQEVAARRSTSYEAPGHWPGITNPLLHLRVTDVQKGNQRIFRLQEAQSDWGQGYRQSQEGKYRKVPEAPYVTNDDWVDLTAKKAIVEAVNSGADEFDLVPGIVHSRRWEGQPGLVTFYDDKLTGALDRALKEAGVPVGKRVETEMSPDPREVSNYFDDMRMEEVADRYDLDLETIADRNMFDDARYFVTMEMQDPGFTKKYLQERTQYKDATQRNLTQKREEFLTLKKEYDEKYSGKPDPEVSQAALLYQKDLDEYDVTRARAELKELESQLKAQEQTIYALEVVTPKMLKEANTMMKPVKTQRYEFEITDDLRNFVQNQGFKNFAKGGIVDVANYLAWS